MILRCLLFAVIAVCCLLFAGILERVGQNCKTEDDRVAYKEFNGMNNDKQRKLHDTWYSIW